MYLLQMALLALLECIPIGVSAIPFFQNNGTKDSAKDVGCLHGWDPPFKEEHFGTVTEVDSVWFEPGTSLKMEQIYDASYHYRYHSEATKRDVYTVGDQGFYGFAFRLHPEWDISGDQKYNIAQLEASLKTNAHNTCNDDQIPSMSKQLSPYT
jgi:hypothetical protein